MTRRSSRGVTWSSDLHFQASKFGESSIDDEWDTSRSSNPTGKPASREENYRIRSSDSSTATDESSIFSKVSTGSKSGQGWRKHGKLHRAKLLVQDEEDGGKGFTLSETCRIEKYYEVAEKVMDQFLRTSVDENQDLTESYLVGNRLVRFLSTVLPTHPDYFSNDPALVQCRNKSQEQLVQLMQYLDQLALIIDEYEYNRYILKDLTDKDPVRTSKSAQPNSLLDTNEISFDEPPVYLDDSSQELFLANVDQEFSEARQMHIEQAQKEDSSSWDDSYSQYASPFESSRVRKHKNDKSKNEVAPKRRTSRASRSDVDTTWTASFPMSFREKYQTGSVSHGTPKGASNDHLYSPPINDPSSSYPIHSGAQNSAFAASHRQSPRSVDGFLEWALTEDGSPSNNASPVHGYHELLAATERPPPNDVSSIAASEQEEMSLTGGRSTQRKQVVLKRFKGCIKCLLD